MSITKTWPSGVTTAAPTSYDIPQVGDLNWGSLTTFLTVLADSAQSTGGQRFAVRVDAGAAVAAIPGQDCIIVTTNAGAKTVTLGAVTDKEVIFLCNPAGGALTIATTGGETILPAPGGALVAGTPCMLVGDPTNARWIRII